MKREIRYNDAVDVRFTPFSYLKNVINRAKKALSKALWRRRPL